jgi:hypothetical protein
MTKESIKKLSISLKQKWASGTRKKNPPETYKKCSETMKRKYASGQLKQKPLPEEIRNRIGEILKVKNKGKILRKTPISEHEKMMNKIRMEQFRRNDPRGKKGPQNQCAEVWRLVSPNNTIHEFRNLIHFIRENENLFNPEDVVWRTKNGRVCKTCKAHGGLSILSPRRKNPHGVWKGWRWYSQVERLNQ